MSTNEHVVRLQVDINNFISGLRTAGASITGFSSSVATANQGMANVGKNANSAKSGINGIVGQLDAGTQNAQALRYALYDVSASLTRIGQAALAPLASGWQTAVSWERAFADVRRTTLAFGSDLTGIRDGLISMTRDVPESFSRLAEIATFGGQLGIANAEIVDFTSVVSRMVATTSLSVETAGTAIGRFKAILGTTGPEFEALASSILKVGINSVATETQIVNVATQISSMAAWAGLSEHEVIGLSGALASVGAPPDLSRGTITRLFTQMSRAVAAGGDRLETFAAVAGTTSQNFAQSWGQQGMGTIVRDFITGLQRLSADGGNAVSILNDLGITSVRDVPLLLRLASASDTVTAAFADAAEGWELQTELATHYGIIVETAEAKLDILGNAFEELSNAIGENFLGPGKNAIDVLTALVQNLSDFANDPYWGQLVTFGVTLSAIVGTVALLGAALASAAAGGIALYTVMGTIKAGGFAAFLGSVATQARAASAGTGLLLGNTTKMNKFGKALVGLGAGYIALRAVTDIDATAISFTNSMDSLLGRANDVDALMSKIRKSAAGANFWDVLGGSASGGWETLSDGAAAINTDFQRLDNFLSEMVKNGNADLAREKLAELRGVLGDQVSDERFNELMANTIGNLGAYAASLNVTTEELDAMASAEEALAESLNRSRDILQLNEDEWGNYLAGITKGASELSNVQSLISEAFARDDEGLFAAGFANADEAFAGFAANLHQSVADVEAWAADIARLSAMGAPVLAGELAAMGPAGQEALAAALRAGPDVIAQVETSARRAAFFASDAFAQGLAQENALLAEAWSQSGMDAVNALITAMQEGASSADIEAIADKFNIELDPALISAVVDPEAEATLNVELDRISKAQRKAIIDLFFQMDPTSLGPSPVSEYLKTGLLPAPKQMEIDANTSSADTKVTDLIAAILRGDTKPVDANPTNARSKIHEVQSAVQAGASMPIYASDHASPTIAAIKANAQAGATMTIGIRTVGSVPRDPAGWQGGQIDMSKANAGLKNSLPAFKNGGGYGKFSGPGSGTSDSILARVSNGEYISTAAAVRYYGSDFFDALNRRRIPRYAEGGGVGTASFPSEMISHMSPDDRALFRAMGDRPVTVTVVLSDVEVANAANRGNGDLGNKGSA